MVATLARSCPPPQVLGFGDSFGLILRSRLNIFEALVPNLNQSAVMTPPPKPGFRRELEARAESVVRDTLNSLPPALHRRAANVPVILESAPDKSLIQEGIEADTLGLFVGNSYPEADCSGEPMPAQLILFLENIWEFSGYDLEEFELEVCRTYLHELGHYLGLDEDDLDRRGLA